MISRALIAALIVAASSTAQARDDRLLLTIEGGLRTPLAKDRLDDTVQFFWGDAQAPEPVQSFGIYQVMRRTNAVGKSDLEACDEAFVLAVVALRDRAKAVGANAVIGIKNIYKNREFRSETQYECRAGYLAASASLEGKLVKLPGPGVQAVPPQPQGFR